MKATTMLRTRLLGAGLLFLSGATALAQNTDLDLTGKVRFYNSFGRQGVQVDVVNRGRHPAFGPSVEVRIKDTHGNVIAEQRGLKLFQYYGGTATAPNTVNPGQQGYIPLSLVGIRLFQGEELHVRIRGEQSSNFGTDHRKARACQKGTANCQ